MNPSAGTARSTVGLGGVVKRLVERAQGQRHPRSMIACPWRRASRLVRSRSPAFLAQGRAGWVWPRPGSPGGRRERPSRHLRIPWSDWRVRPARAKVLGHPPRAVGAIDLASPPRAGIGRGRADRPSGLGPLKTRSPPARARDLAAVWPISFGRPRVSVDFNAFPEPYGCASQKTRLFVASEAEKAERPKMFEKNH
jgi:hypothetical protein